MLTREEAAQYQETGQVTPKFRLRDEVVRAIREKMEAHFAARPELDRNGSLRYAPPATTQFTDCLIETDRTWLDYAIDPDILDAVSQLLGNDIIVGPQIFSVRKAREIKLRRGIRMGCTGPCGH